MYAMDSVAENRNNSFSDFEGYCRELLSSHCFTLSRYLFRAFLDLRQVLLETHDNPKGTAKFFQSFFDHGFGLFSKEQNPWGKGGCLEYSFVRLHLDFWKRTSPTLPN
jgi:hypothetical protein